MTGLALLLQSNTLRTALQPYTLDGPYGRLLDAAEQGLELADMQCFETEALMGQGGDRKSVVEGKRVSVRVDLGGRRLIHKNNTPAFTLIATASSLNTEQTKKRQNAKQPGDNTE